ncbi:MAG: sigma-70 family RNA polymerase sigma factor [Acidobacteria bacterium]|jgi:RNA polymerase sigma-70 factor (ECF subfamily)|nr:sigma-70 family RNA polymerase sigma factor [Acidobacteriota bacterium]
MDERDLIRCAQLGDRDAFAGLVSSHEKKLLALCWNMLGEREEARDAAQEALLQAFENLSRFDAGRSFVKWLLGIGAKRCLDRLRRKRTFLRIFKVHAGEWLGGGEPRPEAVAENESTGRLLLKLPPRERAAISLAVFDDFSAREIAATLGCAENTARVHLFNARLKLKKEVADGL